MALDTVQEIKEKLTIQDIVAPYVKLKKAGKSLVGLCPFHKEKTPSFHVSLDRGTWHCFGCGEGGDGFSFIEKIEGVDFKGALKILADKAGVRVEYAHGGRERSERLDRLRELLNRATAWYAGNFIKSDAEAYAKKRGLSAETIASWRLGYAPDAWRALLETLTTDKFTIPELLAVGLIKEADGKRGTYYDRFRNRLIFPLCDVAGRVVAFTGRTLEADTAESESQAAKYLNSPETELFHKSDLLFGMDRAKDAIRTRNFTMLVEGQMDVLLAHQAGFTNAVALSGTALSEKHCALMKRYSENLMLILDADAAGLSATAKAAALALRQGLRVKAVRLPSGKDPADLIHEDPKNFTEYIKKAQPIVEFFLSVLTEQEHDVHRLVTAAEQTVLPLINAIPSPMEREHFVQIAARALDLSNESIRASLAKLPAQVVAHETVPARDSVTIKRRTARELRDEQLRAICRVYSDTALAKRVESEYNRIIEAHQLPSDALPESALFAVEQAFGEHPREDAADDVLKAFEELVVRDAYQDAVARLRAAERKGDTAMIREAQEMCAHISARLASLG